MTAKLTASADGSKVTIGTAAEDALQIDATAKKVVAMSGYAIGYALGGGYVVQATDKTTPITLNVASGAFGTAASALAANQTVRFTMNNSKIGINDVLVLNRVAGGTGSSYQVWCDFTTDGTAGICIRNISGGSLSESINVNFAIIKGAGA
jgi:hypothetical protein